MKKNVMPSLRFELTIPSNLLEEPITRAADRMPTDLEPPKIAAANAWMASTVPIIGPGKGDRADEDAPSPASADERTNAKPPCAHVDPITAAALRLERTAISALPSSGAGAENICTAKRAGARRDDEQFCGKMHRRADLKDRPREW